MDVDSCCKANSATRAISLAWEADYKASFVDCGAVAVADDLCLSGGFPVSAYRMDLLVVVVIVPTGN